MTTHSTAKENAKRFASAIRALQACEVACTHCATEFGKNGHAEAMTRCIGVCTDCAECHAPTRRSPGRNSEFVELLLGDRAEICSQYAEGCDHHGQGHCNACATACRACLDVCLEVVGVEAITAEPIVF